MYTRDTCKNCTGWFLEVLVTLNNCRPVWAEPCIYVDNNSCLYCINILVSYAYTAYVHIVVGLKFLVRLCTDLGSKDAQEYM